MLTTLLFRFLKVMFSGFAALLWAAAILCFVATAIQAGKEGEEMVGSVNLSLKVLTSWLICRLMTTSTLGSLLCLWWW